MIARSLLLGCLLTAAVAAQSSNNLFEIYSGCTNFTSRGTLATSAGEVLMQIPASHFSGVGQDASGDVAEFAGFRYLTQSQNAAVPSTYHLVLRSPHASGAPDCSPAGLRYRHGPLSLPSGSGIVAWVVTSVPATPLPPIQTCQTLFMGAELAAAPNWTSAGQSLHISTYYSTGGTSGDNPRPNAPNLAWDCVAGAARQGNNPYCIRFGLLTPACVLNTGNVDPTMIPTGCLAMQDFTSWGAGGLFPLCQGATGPRNDGIAVRVRDVAHANGIFVTLLSHGPGLCPGFACPPLIAGRIFSNLPPLSMVGPSGVLDASGEGRATVLTPGSQVRALCNLLQRNMLNVQAFGMTPGVLPASASNRAGVQF
jgi:hypothetical protein